MARWRRELRSTQMWSAGRNALARRPKICRRWIPWQSCPSLVGRPLMFWTCCGSTKSTAQPRASNSREEGNPKAPRRSQGDRGDLTGAKPVGQGCKGGGGGGKAAPGGGIVAGGARHRMRFGPDVDARGVEVGGSELRGEGRLGA